MAIHQVDMWDLCDAVYFCDRDGFRVGIVNEIAYWIEMLSIWSVFVKGDTFPVF